MQIGDIVHYVRGGIGAVGRVHRTTAAGTVMVHGCEFRRGPRGYGSNLRLATPDEVAQFTWREQADTLGISGLHVPFPVEIRAVVTGRGTSTRATLIDLRDHLIAIVAWVESSPVFDPDKPSMHTPLLPDFCRSRSTPLNLNLDGCPSLDAARAAEKET